MRRRGRIGRTGPTTKRDVRTCSRMCVSAASSIEPLMPALGDALAVLAKVLDPRGLRWFGFGAQAVAGRGKDLEAALRDVF